MASIITDELDSLKVYHYTDCNNNSSDDVKEMRGIIKENNTVVCRSFPFTPEYTTEQLSELEPYTTETIRWYESQEGTILRLWEHEGKWNLSTHRKINSFLSKWGGNSSYGELFLKALHNTKGTWLKTSWADDDGEEEDKQDIFNEFCKLCNKDYIYVLLIRNTDANRIVVKGYTEPQLFCLGTFHRPTNFKYSPAPSAFPIKMPSEVKQSSLQGLADYVMKYVNPLKLQGLIGITSSGKMIKLVHPKYYLYEQSRGNASSLEFRYIQLLHKQETKALFTELYDDSSESFKEIDEILDSICTNIFKKYLQRYIHKQVAVLPPYQFNVCKTLHERYITKEIEKVTPDIIRSTVFNLHEKELYSFVKQYKKTKKQHGNGNFVDQTSKQSILIHRARA